MSGRSGMDGGPRSVVVVGAGIVGLSTAWFLQDRGVDVTVVDRTGIAAGASWGNAGWVSPALTTPLNSPSVLREGLRAMADPAAALHIPLRADPGLARFLLRFAANCRPAVWQRAARANAVLNDEALETFDVLVANGVDAPMTDTSIAVAFRDTDRAAAFRRDLDRFQGSHKPTVEVLAGAALRTHLPLASAHITSVVNVAGQRFVDPGRFTHALARAVVERGATISTDEVRRVLPVAGGVNVEVRAGEPLHADAAVAATGAWLPPLLGRRVRVGLHAGRGYSFTVPVERPLPGPIYLPEARVACTPYRTGLRIAGTMEFRRPEEPLFRRRVEAIVTSASPLLDGVRWHERRDEWVGSRPVTDDGMPLIGQIDHGVYVAGGHGMWGLAHGPASGRLLAEQIVTGKQPEAARAFDPLRRS